MENNFSRRLLPQDEIKIGSDALELGVRIPWYRSLPLSVVEVAELTLDGETIPTKDLRWSLNGREFSPAELGEQTSEFWYVLDSARITVPRSLDSRRPHAVSLTLNLYPPYIPGLTWVTRGSVETGVRS